LRHEFRSGFGLILQRIIVVERHIAPHVVVVAAVGGLADSAVALVADADLIAAALVEELLVYRQGKKNECVRERESRMNESWCVECPLSVTVVE
jgi:hypothetical protein